MITGVLRRSSTNHLNRITTHPFYERLLILVKMDVIRPMKLLGGLRHHFNWSTQHWVDISITTGPTKRVPRTNGNNQTGSSLFRLEAGAISNIWRWQNNWNWIARRARLPRFFLIFSLSTLAIHCHTSPFQLSQPLGARWKVQLTQSWSGANEAGDDLELLEMWAWFKSVTEITKMDHIP